MARILIVDDSLFDRTRAVEAIRLLGHAPLIATDAESGLALCRAERPDLERVEAMIGEALRAAA